MFARLNSLWLAAPLLMLAGALVHFSMAPLHPLAPGHYLPLATGFILYRSTPSGDFGGR